MSAHTHTNGGHASIASPPGPPGGQQTGAPGSSSAPSTATTAPVPHIRIVPHLDAPRSLHFEVVDKDVPEGFVLKIGRFTDKQALPNRVTFKSKVVSRGHAEIYTERGRFFIRDTKSSSGTFLNHARLSPPGVESKPTLLKDGDVVQLGVDYQGGTQEIYRCVKMRLELNRSWQQQPNAFRANTLKVIRNLTTANAASATDCCICLFRIASFQSLFVAPCSHVYHYKCIRPLLMANHPGFLCPLCRTFADLEDSVEIDDPVEEEIPAEDVAAAIENATRQQEAAVEQVIESPVVEESVAQAGRPLTEALTEEAYAPTPPSVQAHTFQPPEHDTYPAERESSGQSHAQVQERLAPSPLSHEDMDLDIQQRGNPTNDVEEINEPRHFGDDQAPTTPAQQTELASSPMDIVTPSVPVSGGQTSISSVNSSAMQSPSSAFFMAPSPPAFGSSSNMGSTPISFGSPSRPQSGQQNTSVSPSNHISAAGNMIQNFVRNISIPTRNRTRTNSNSPLNPIIQQQQQQQPGSSSSGSVALSTQEPLHNRMQHQQTLRPGDGNTDVFGKTLVVTPPPMNSLNLVSAEGHNSGPAGGYRVHTSFSSGASELRAVSEMELEYPTGESSSEGQQNGLEEGHSSQNPHQYHSSSQQAGSQEPEGQEQSQHSQSADGHEQHLSQSQQQSQSQHSPYSLQQATETSV
ncbi:hypothetical protein BG015_003660 [Linnemannia schmuckeri]|uniref:SMAD/FHA domain-containing protein n=1 Tax=Linnemannia schmuckeri TaxID=64567 RepID=A0A9P5S2B0_9FUNG|nr:hypothetical protein BG015_003660 [Linnemannia schmuckeri]